MATTPTVTKKRPWIWWVGGAVAFLIVLFLIYLAIPKGQSKEEVMKAQTALNQEKAKAAAAEAALKLKVAELDSLKKNCPAKKPAAKSQASNAGTGKSQQGTQTAPTVPPVQKVIIEIRDLRTETGVSGGTVGDNVRIKSATIKTGTTGEAEYNVEETQVQKANITIVKNPIPLCVRLGEGAEAQYWPHTAILNGEEFPEAVDNHHGGYNLSIIPKGSLETIDPNQDYGTTEDLISYVRASRLDKPENINLSKAIMVSTGVFKPAQLYNGLYIAK